MKKDKAIVNLILTICFGYFGIYRLLKGQIGLFLLYLFTCGLFGIGWIIDIICAIGDLASAKSDVQSRQINNVRRVPFEPVQQVQPKQDLSIPPKNFVLYKMYDKVDLFCEGDMRPDYHSIKQGDIVHFDPDESNIHDSKTIEVYTDSYEFCGYMYNNKLRSMVSDYIDIYGRGIVKGEISYINESESIVRLNLYFYNHAE